MKTKVLYIILVLAVLFNSCAHSDYIEVKESSEPIEELVSTIIEFYSTFDVLEDFITNNDLMGKKDELLIPNSVKFVITDSLFTDGNGVAAYLDFGELGGEEPYGVLCKDEKYRAGRIYLMLNLPYSHQLAKLKILFSADEPFYSGNGKDMCQYNGQFQLGKLGDNIITIDAQDLGFENASGHVYSFNCNNLIEKVVDNSRGVMYDQIEITGEFQINDSKNSFSASVKDELKKNYSPGCITNIVAGSLEFDINDSGSDIEADFDPYDNEECDDIVLITINNKSVLYQF